MRKILITGGTGFIGRNLSLMNEFKDAYFLGRKNIYSFNNFIHCELSYENDYRHILKDFDIVIHLAARVHAKRKLKYSDELNKHVDMNAKLTSNLALQASEVGVKKFIFLSTIKVNGDNTKLDEKFDESSEIKPNDPYGISKAMAENKLKEIMRSSNMSCVIIRPAMVYGDLEKGNLPKLLKLIKYGFPLPFLKVENKRSMISINNLCDFIRFCVNEKVKNVIIPISDKENISTTQLVNTLASASSIKLRIFHIPNHIMKRILRVIGQNGLWIRLFESLEIDNSYAVKELGWEQPFKQHDELIKFVNKSLN